MVGARSNDRHVTVQRAKAKRRMGLLGWIIVGWPPACWLSIC